MNSLNSYTSFGWSIFPVNGKVPFAKGGFHQAVDDCEQAEKLFKPHPGCNLAVATGKVSGIFVLDIDIKKETKGDESLIELTKKYTPLPNTILAKTWSGGFHYYFNYPHDIIIKNKAGIQPGIDIRGDGGYVVAPPSVIEGKTYEWINHPDKTNIADAPEWLIQLIIEHKPVIDLSAENGGVIRENRNDTLMYMGVGLRRMGWNGERINELLQETNTLRCKPPLSDTEVTKISKSVARYAKKTELKKPLTDVYSAKFFTDVHGKNIRHCDALGGWFIWTDTHWAKDDSYEIMTLAKNVAKKMREQGINQEDKHLIKHGVKTESRAKLDAMVALAKSNNVAVPSEQFDQDHYVINCQNGTLHLNSQELVSHTKTDYCTKMTLVAYLPEAKAIRWTRFLEEIFWTNGKPDYGLIRYMQKAIGYSLSGSVEEQCIFILYGTGSNGKSTFLKHIYKVLGNYAISTPASTLMEKYGDTIPNDIARLKGIRFVTTIESSQSRQLADSVVKLLTGDDPISARFLHREYFDFFATFKIFLATNHKPIPKGTDEGIWRRLITIPFDRMIAEEERDPLLDDTLRSEYEGIFAWAVEGYRLWKKEGLETTSRIEEMKKEYRNDSDVIGQFIGEECLCGAGMTVSAGDLQREVGHWCKDSGIRTIKRSVLNSYLFDKKFYKEQGTMGSNKGRYVWHGIGFKDEKKNHWYRDNA